MNASPPAPEPAATRPLTLGLAPMEGLTPFPTRLWLALACAPAVATTPFLRATRGSAGSEVPRGFAPELFELAGALPYEVTPQLMAADADSFVRVAARFLGASPTVELNCGCPQPTCLGKGAGSGLLADPEAFYQVLRRVTEALGPRRVAVKMRLGIEDRAELPALLEAARAVPLARLTVHGRTRLERYAGKAHWDAIEAAAQRVDVPTWGSGDILGHASLAAAQRAAPTLAGVFVGRGALRNPWVFGELATGRAVEVSVEALTHALLVFALVTELSHTEPPKLLQRLASGRLGTACGTAEAAWERLAAQLFELTFRAPFTPLGMRTPRAPAFSAQTEARIAVLWRYLRSALPPALAGEGRLPRRLGDVTERLFAASARHGLRVVTLTHRAEHDRAFEGGGGLAAATGEITTPLEMRHDPTPS